MALYSPSFARYTANATACRRPRINSSWVVDCDLGLADGRGHSSLFEELNLSCKSGRDLGNGGCFCLGDRDISLARLACDSFSNQTSHRGKYTALVL
jgi:hypothetical protein